MKSPFNLVIADDDADDQMIIREAILETISDPVNIISVSDGLELLSLLSTRTLNEPTDAILLDVHMPLLNGLEVLEKIKNDPALKHIPVFMLSTFQTVDRFDTSMSLGAISFFSKPNNIDGYKPILQQIFRYGDTERQVSA